MAREELIDIHDYDRISRRAERGVQTSSLSDRNKSLIFSYRDVCLRRNVCGQVRLIRVLGALKLFGRLMEKDFDMLTKADLEDLVSQLLCATPAYSAETIGSYKAILKKFMSWVLAPDDFPNCLPHPMLSWIKCHVRAKDKRRLQRRDLLTPEEAARLVKVCRHPRDRAFVSALWESGGRIAEVGNRKLKDLTRHTHGFLIDLRGKTGERTPLLVGSAPYLAAWLAYHPYANDPEAPLWVYQDSPSDRPARYMRYAALRKILITLFRRAGINKRPNPHGLRHSRATDLGASGRMNESQLKAYLGWTPTSTMPGNYAHLTVQDANNAILAEHGLAPTAAHAVALGIKQCQVCQELNVSSAMMCVRCARPLDALGLLEAHATVQDNAGLILQLCKVLVDKGLLSDAADAVHQAGLGQALQALAGAAARHDAP